MIKNESPSKKRNKFIFTQREEMSNQVSNLITLSVFLIITFVAILVTDNKNSSPISGGYLPIFITMAVGAVLFWGCSIIATHFITRALIFHLLISLCTFFFLSAPVFIIIIFAQLLMGQLGWVINSVIVVTLAIGYFDEFQKIFNELQVLEKSLVASGRFDKERGVWNVKVPMNLPSSGKNRTSKIKFIIIAIQLVAMAFFVIVGSSFRAPLMIIYMWYVVIYFPIRKIAEPAAISANLFLWENKLGQAIIIEPDEF